MDTPLPLSQRIKIYYKTFVPLFEKPKVGAYTMFILSFFTIAIFGAFAIRPTLATIVQLKKRIEDNKVVNQKLENKINQLRLADKEYEQIQQDLDAVFETLPNKPETASLLGKLNRVLTENGIDVVILQFDPIDLTPPETASSSAAKLTFTLSGKASYQDALKFINLLSNMDRIITIDVVDMQGSAAQADFSQAGTVTLTVKGKAYVLWEKEDEHG